MWERRRIKNRIKRRQHILCDDSESRWLTLAFCLTKFLSPCCVCPSVCLNHCLSLLAFVLSVGLCSCLPDSCSLFDNMSNVYEHLFVDLSASLTISLGALLKIHSTVASMSVVAPLCPIISKQLDHAWISKAFSSLKTAINITIWALVQLLCRWGWIPTDSPLDN